MITRKKLIKLLKSKSLCRYDMVINNYNDEKFRNIVMAKIDAFGEVIHLLENKAVFDIEYKVFVEDGK